MSCDDDGGSLRSERQSRDALSLPGAVRVRKWGTAETDNWL